MEFFYHTAALILNLKTLARDQADELWDRYWNDAHKEWFKLEVLQDYPAEDGGPSLRSWTRGDKQKKHRIT